MTASTDEVVAPHLSPWRRFWREIRRLDEALTHTETDDLWDRIRSLEARVDGLSRARLPAVVSTVSASAEPGPPRS